MEPKRSRPSRQQRRRSLKPSPRPRPSRSRSPRSRFVKALHAADSGLTIAGKVGTLAGQTIDVMIEGMEAAFYQDAAGMEKVTAKIEKITGKVEANNSKLEAALADYADDSAACRAAAK